MQIILKHIPKNTTYGHIQLFLKSALEGGVFSKSGAVENISVLAQKSMLSNKMEFHVILTIQPDTVATRVIEKLHGKELNGRLIAVAEYIERSVNNGRGKIRSEDESKEGRRQADRRDTKKLFRLIKIEQLQNFVWPEEKC